MNAPLGRDGRPGEASSAYDVCVITTIHPDYDKRVYRQICALADAGLSVCVVAAWDFGARPRDDYDYVALARPATRPARVMHSWRTYRAARGVDARAYIFHDPDFLPFAPALKRASNRPVVYDAHDNIPEDIRYGKDWIPRFLRAPVSWAFRRFENRVVRRLGRAIVTVPHLNRRFTALGAEVVEVRNYPRFAAPAELNQEPGILYTGTLTRDYGVEHLLRIAALTKERGLDVPMRVVDMFAGDEALRARFLETIERDRLPIEMMAPVRSDEMPLLLRRGTIGLSPIVPLPNKVLALPTKIFEYYAFGIVVIASDGEGSRIATEDGTLALLVAHDDHKGWVDRIERVLQDERLRATMRERGVAAAMDRFSWQGEQEKLVQYVRRLISQDKPGPRLASAGAEG